MVKLRKLCDAYLESHPDLSYSTKLICCNAMQFLAMAVGDKLITQVNYGDAERYRNWLRAGGRAKTTTNIYTRAISPIFAWAVKKTWLTCNPFAGLGQLKVTRNPNRTYTDWQFERLYRYANDLWKGRLLAAAEHGLRAGEVLNLTVDNIRDGYIFIEPKKETSLTWRWEPKDKEIRMIPLSARLRDWLRCQSQLYPFLSDRRIAGIYRLKSEGLLSDENRNRPDANFRRDFVAIQRRAFGRQIGTFHELRKTYATRMLRVLPAYFVAKLMGHSNVRTLETHYAAGMESYFEIARTEASKAGTSSVQMPAGQAERLTAAS